MHFIWTIKEKKNIPEITWFIVILLFGLKSEPYLYLCIYTAQLQEMQASYFM